MAQAMVLDEYENGCRAIRGKESFYVEFSEGETIEFGGSYGGRHRKPTRLYAALCVQLGRIPLLEDPSKVPIEVATAGKPAIVSYLYTAHYDSQYEEFGYYSAENNIRNKLGEIVDVGPETVSKYFRRVLNDVDDQRVGGRAF